MTYSVPALFQDLTGRTFRKLTVAAPGRPMENLNKGVAWLCRCRCGGVTAESSSRLLSGEAKNCAMCNPHTGTVWVSLKANPALVMSLRAAVTLMGNPVWMRGLTARVIECGCVMHKTEPDELTGEVHQTISKIPFTLSDSAHALQDVLGQVLSMEDGTESQV